MPSSSGTWFAMFSSVTSTAGRSPRILIVRLGAMGDVIHTLPAAADLRAALPAARIAWAVETRWSSLLQANPHIDRTIPVPLRRWRKASLRRSTWTEAGEFLNGLRTNSFDLAIDFQGLLKSAALATLSGARRIVGFERGILREPPAELAYSRRTGASLAHVVDRYRELAAFASGHRPAGPAAFALPVGEPREGLPARFVLASPEAGWGAKEWPPESYARLASTLWKERRIPLVADCAPGRTHVAELIRRMAPAGAVLPHPSTIPQLIGATRAAAAVVGVDSGPLHLAAALGKSGVAIFGPTDPTRNGPYGRGIAVVRSGGAATTYKRRDDPSASMQACSEATVYEALAPSLG